jgi:hypothetical protein
MTDRFRIFGATLAAITAIGALTAVGAQAVAGEFHILGSSSAVKGEAAEANFNVLGGFIVKCANAGLEGPQGIKTVSDLTLTPRLENCKAGGNPVEVITNGCKYTQTGTAELTAQLGIVGCTAGKHGRHADRHFHDIGRGQSTAAG